MSRKGKRNLPAAAPAISTEASSGASGTPASSRNTIAIAVAAVGILAIAGVLWRWTHDERPLPAAPAVIPAKAAATTAAEFVDETQCVGCHTTQAQLWHGSHHDLAMQEASDQTVLGNFSNTVFTKDGVRTRFTQRDGKYWINTDGPDGKPTDYEVKYTFGVEPLQQYLLELDRGRLQAFTVAWDTQRQRWFHLYPDERIDYRDELHWTKPSQNWNFMCAECHSTDLKKNYDPSTRTYRTTWKQIDVGCQACHGEASLHLAWARDADHRSQATGHASQAAGESKNTESTLVKGVRSASATGLSPGSSRVGFGADLVSGDATLQIETCARCHSRRAPIWGDYRHGQRLMDTHLPALLEERLYFADGQIDGEVYEYGSFVQSKMHQKGLRCSDCHEPHSLKTRGEGNALCVSCHNATAPAARASIDISGLKRRDYDAPSHHFHKQGEAGSACVDCHAPQRTYMVVDPRRDHSFRIPRPDLSAKLGTPNACNVCHEKRTAEWATQIVAKWYGPQRRQEPVYGEALWAGRTHQPSAVATLAKLASASGEPAIVRASALQLLQQYPGAAALPSLLIGLQAEDPLIRVAAVNAMDMIPPQQRVTQMAPLLTDAVRAVRLAVTASIAPAPGNALQPAQLERLAVAIGEYEAAQRENADQPSSWMNLGNLHAALGDPAKAEMDYQAAINLDPAFVPGYVNLADLKSRTGMNAVAIPLLQSGLEVSPGNATLHHSLGLALVREQRLDQALAELGKAAKLAPNDPRFAYVYAVALHDTGKTDASIAVLEQALRAHPGSRDLLSTLAAYARERGDERTAARYMDRLRTIEPTGAEP